METHTNTVHTHSDVILFIQSKRYKNCVYFSLAFFWSVNLLGSVMSYFSLCVPCGPVSRRHNSGSGQPVSRLNRPWRWRKKQICTKLGSEKHTVYDSSETSFYCSCLPLANLLSMFVCMQMEVQCEQLSRELVRHRQQLEREAQALQERLGVAREEARTEARKQKEELAHTVNLFPSF